MKCTHKKSHKKYIDKISHIINKAKECETASGIQKLEKALHKIDQKVKELK